MIAEEITILNPTAEERELITELARHGFIEHISGSRAYVEVPPSWAEPNKNKQYQSTHETLTVEFSEARL